MSGLKSRGAGIGDDFACWASEAHPEYPVFDKKPGIIHLPGDEPVWISCFRHRGIGIHVVIGKNILLSLGFERNHTKISGAIGIHEPENQDLSIIRDGIGSCDRVTKVGVDSVGIRT